ncbi:hypothetical protein PI125_g1202 [Phytophthora idaei]|nr:hypothetical protein PI125_g1202 [Phytophthora idaei]
MCNGSGRGVDHNGVGPDDDEMNEWHLPCQTIQNEVGEDIELYEATCSADRCPNKDRGIEMRRAWLAHHDEPSERGVVSGQRRSVSNLLNCEQASQLRVARRRVGVGEFKGGVHVDRESDGRVVQGHTLVEGENRLH